MAVRGDELVVLGEQTPAFPLVLHGPRFVLTEREADVLVLLAAGLSTGDIARRLYVSRQAVTYHVGNLLAKLQCENRTGLVARAFVLGLLAIDAWPPRLADGAREDPRKSLGRGERLTSIRT